MWTSFPKAHKTPLSFLELKHLLQTKMKAFALSLSKMNWKKMQRMSFCWFWHSSICVIPLMRMKHYLPRIYFHASHFATFFIFHPCWFTNRNPPSPPFSNCGFNLSLITYNWEQPFNCKLFSPISYHKSWQVQVKPKIVVDDHGHVLMPC